MRKSRFTEEQTIGMVKEQEAGLPTAEVCRKHGLMPRASWLSGATTTTTSGRTHPWGTGLRHKRPGRSCKMEASRPARLAPTCASPMGVLCSKVVYH